MTKDEIRIKISVAKLAGVWTKCQRIGGCLHDRGMDFCCCDDGSCDLQEPWPNHLESYDAILPVVRKCFKAFTIHQRQQFFNSLRVGMMSISVQNYELILFATPEQLCIALLKATGDQP